MQNILRCFVFLLLTSLATTATADQLAGHWAGTLVQQNPAQEFKMYLILLPTSRSGTAGTWSLGNGCGGNLEQVERQLTQIALRAATEMGQDRDGRCLDNGRIQIELIDEQNIYFEMTYLNHPEVQLAGTLMRMNNELTGTAPPVADVTIQTTNINKYSIGNNTTSQILNVKMCSTQLDSVGNCTVARRTFSRSNTVMINVSYDVIGTQQDNQIVAKWYRKYGIDEHEYLAGKDIPLVIDGIDNRGNFFFTIERDYPNGDYLLEIVTDNGEVATQEFSIVP